MCRKGGGDEFTRNALFKKKVTLNIQLNEKLTGFTKLDETQRNISLLCTALKVMSYGF